MRGMGRILPHDRPDLAAQARAPAPTGRSGPDMSPAARQVLLVAILAVVLGVQVTRAGVAPWSSDTPDAFPRDVAVTAAPTPNIYSQDEEMRIVQVIAAMNGMWERAFVAAGDEYERPRVEARDGQAESDCGTGQTGWAGVYCFSGRRIVVDLNAHLVRSAMAGEDRADLMLGYVLAHEIGHHVQALRGAVRQTSQQHVLRAELHAECLAGVWGKAAGRPLPPHDSFTPDADHGTVAQQVHWMRQGYAGGRPASCDPVWTADTL
jgi:predicted metalloprotease